MEKIISEVLTLTDEGMDNVPIHVATARLFLAMLFAGIIGFDREVQHKPAGLRTHILVSLAAALFVLIALELVRLEDLDDPSLVFDPLRLMEGITSGVAFLAAGMIILTGGKIEGLTTGAGLWFVGAIGFACGAGFLQLAATATFLGFVVLRLLRPITKKFEDPDYDEDAEPAGHAKKQSQ